MKTVAQKLMKILSFAHSAVAFALIFSLGKQLTRGTDTADMILLSTAGDAILTARESEART